MAAKRLRKNETPLQRVEKIEKQIAKARTQLKRTTTRLQELERQRTYYVRKSVERGIS